jgi:hypothetical protein
MRYLFIAFIALISISGLSQKTEQKVHSVQLFSGDIFNGSRLIYTSPILKTPVFELDEKKFESPTVAFFQNNHGYFANLTKIYGPKNERYAIRIKSGKINLFEEIEIEPYAGDELSASDSEENEMLATGEVFGFYNKGNGEIKKANYKNLRTDMADNEAATKELKAYRNMRYLQFALIGVGAGVIAYDIFKQRDNNVEFTVPIALGIAIGGSSYFLESKKEDALWLAVDAYNK